MLGCRPSRGTVRRSEPTLSRGCPSKVLKDKSWVGDHVVSGSHTLEHMETPRSIGVKAPDFWRAL